MGQEVIDYGATVNDGTGDALHVLSAKVDAGARLFTVIDRDLTAPPGAESVGDTYIVGGSATGAWATHDGKVAVFGLGSTWQFVTLVEGLFAWLQDEDILIRYNGSSWVEFVEGGTSLVDFKNSVRVATTADGALATAYENGDTVDGVVLATNDRLLLKDQSTGSENGIYTVNASGAPTRATDFDEDAEVTAGAAVIVEEGTANADKLFILTTNNPITVGSTALTFSALSSGGPGSDTTAIHDDTSGEINAITEKVTPVSTDLILIEDSAASNVKKRVQIGNIAAVTGGGSAAFNGATVKNAAALTAQNYTTPAAVTFDTDVEDIGGWHDTVSNTSRLTAPSGVTKVDIGAYIELENITADEYAVLHILKNGSVFREGIATETGETSRRLSIAVINAPCVATDYFECQITVETDTSVDVSAASEFTIREASNASVVGQQTLYVPAGAMVSRTTNGAAAGSVETTTNKVMLQTLDFDTATDEFAQFSVQMPKSWDEGTVHFQYIWSHPSTATNFGVAFFVQAVAFANDDAADTAFGTAIGVTDTGGTTDDIYISAESAAVTVAGSPGAEEWVVFQIYRDVSDAGDTLAVDARLHGVKIHYTTDAATDD